MIYGMEVAWPSPTIPILISNDSSIKITIEEASYLPIISPISAAISGLFYSKLMDVIGRKRFYLMITIPYVSAALLIIFSNTIYIFYVSRIIYGLSDAFIFMVLPTFIAEISTPKIRVKWGTVIPSSYYFGSFLINIIGSFLSIKTTGIILAILPAIFFVAFVFVPETPYYYVMKKRIDEAENALKKYLQKSNVDEELNQLKSDVSRQISERGHFKDLFINKVNRRSLIIITILRAAQCFSGILAFTSYTTYIFDKVNTNMSSSVSSILYSGILWVATLLPMVIVDRIGRRILLITSCTCCALSLIIETTYFWLNDFTDCNLNGIKWFPLFWLCVYTISFSIGLGTMPIIMLGELFSASIKGYALSFVNFCFSIFYFVSTKLFEYLLNTFGLSAAFMLFAICTSLSVVFVIFYVPETKNKSLEEIQQDLMKIR